MEHWYVYKSINMSCEWKYMQVTCSLQLIVRACVHAHVNVCVCVCVFVCACIHACVQYFSACVHVNTCVRERECIVGKFWNPETGTLLI